MEVKHSAVHSNNEAPAVVKEDTTGWFLIYNY